MSNHTLDCEGCGEDRRLNPLHDEVKCKASKVKAETTATLSGTGLYAVLSHALELGYLDSGSTASWAREEIAKYEAVAKASGIELPG